MDEPARKRRRTNSPEERASSPLRKPPRRPSFASPTKASLARNYPNLLRPTSAGSPGPRPSSRGDILARGKQARAFVLGETDMQQELSQEALGEVESRVVTGKQQNPALDQNVTPRARKTTGQRGAPILTSALEEEEQDLPTTPSQRGLEEQDGPRRGVLFSSPSKRPPRIVDPVKQSPLKQKAQVHKDALVNSIGREPDNTENQSGLENKQPLDPALEKKKHEKARLQRELEELEAQVLKCTDEIVKEQQRAPNQTLGVPEYTGLM